MQELIDFKKELIRTIPFSIGTNIVDTYKELLQKYSYLYPFALQELEPTLKQIVKDAFRTYAEFEIRFPYNRLSLIDVVRMLEANNKTINSYIAQYKSIEERLNLHAMYGKKKQTKTKFLITKNDKKVF